MDKLLARMLLVSICVFFLSCEQNKSIIIASKPFTENNLLAAIMGFLIEEYTDISVNIIDNYGDTFSLYADLRVGKIDMYPEYIATIDNLFFERVEDKNNIDDEWRNKILKEKGVRIVSSFGFENNYVLIMKKPLADKLGIQKISDIISYPELTLAFEQEFISREDGYPLLKSTYKLKNKVSAIDIRFRKLSLERGLIDITDAYTTDGDLLEHNFVQIEDDRGALDRYIPVAFVSETTLKKYPEIVGVLEQLENLITANEMQHFNFQVLRANKEDIYDLVKTFLKMKGLI